MQLHSKRPVTEINVTPLVDIVLVLLIIFMVLTPLVDKQKFLRVPELPSDASARPEVGEDAVLIALPDGRVRLEAEVLSLETAVEKLRAGYQNRPGRVLYFNADDGTSYELAFRALDAAHAAGVQAIALLTEPPADL